MSLFNSFDKSKHLSELGDPLLTQGQGVMSAATRRQTALRNLTGSATFTIAQARFLDAVVAGTVAASKAVVVDANLDVGTFRQVRATRFLDQKGAFTSYATVGAQTYTAADILSGTIIRDCNGASRSDVLPTAALLVAAVPGAAVGDVIECLIVNGADAAETITIGAGTGGGFDANQTAASRVITQNTSKVLRIRLTNVTAASEAYVVAC